MKYIGIAALCLSLMACQGKKHVNVQLKSQKDSVSYAVGLDIARNLKRQSIDIDLDVLIRGLREMYTGDTIALTDSQSQSVTATFRKQMRTRHWEDMKIRAEKNKKEGDAFFAENRKRDGVVTLPSGLQYKVITMGTGKKPKQGQSVTVNYRGTFLDGTEFDNTYARNKPETYAINSVLKGWQEPLKMMPVGSEWILYIPAELAYGERGAGQAIPPNATLIYELKLLEIH